MSEDMIKKKRANYQFIPIPSVGGFEACSIYFR